MENCNNKCIDCGPVYKHNECIETKETCVDITKERRKINVKPGDPLVKALDNIEQLLSEIHPLKDVFRLENVGGGAEVYKGETNVGGKELRTLNEEDFTISITQQENDILIKSNYNLLKIVNGVGLLGGGFLEEDVELSIDPSYDQFENYYRKDETLTEDEINGSIGNAEITFRREGQDVDSFFTNQFQDQTIELEDLRGYPGADVEFRFRTSTSFTTAPSVNKNDRAPANWSLTMPSVTPGNYLWAIQTNIKYDDTLKQPWSNPFRYTGKEGIDGIDGSPGPQGPPGTNGPAMMYRGDWKASETYLGQTGTSSQAGRVDFVVMPDGTGYVTRIDAGSFSGSSYKPGSGSKWTQKWNGPISNANAIFADFVMAYSAYIDNLTVGAIQTGPNPTSSQAVPATGSNDFERTTLGYKPPANMGSNNYKDPTAKYTRHGQRQYYPNGRIMSYMGYVTDFSQDGITLNNEFAIIVWKDNGDLFFVLDSTTTDGPRYNIPSASFQHRTAIRIGNVGDSQSTVLGKLNNLEYRRWESQTDLWNIIVQKTNSYYAYTYPEGGSTKTKMVNQATTNSSPITDGWYLTALGTGTIYLNDTSTTAGLGIIKYVGGFQDDAISKNLTIEAINAQNFTLKDGNTTLISNKSTVLVTSANYPNGMFILYRYNLADEPD